MNKYSPEPRERMGPLLVQSDAENNERPTIQLSHIQWISVWNKNVTLSATFSEVAIVICKTGVAFQEDVNIRGKNYE